MRLFVAVRPPEPAIEELDAFLSVRREAAAPRGTSRSAWRWTPPEAWHVTLAFCEHAPERAYDELVERLGRAASRRTPFETAIVGGGAFPNVGRARVLWAGLSLDEASREELGRLATGARAAAVKSGIAVDGTRFRAHVTLARLGQPQELSNWVRLLDAYRGPAFAVDRLELVESHLGEGPRGRPRYEVLDEFPLGRAAGQPATP